MKFYLILLRIFVRWFWRYFIFILNVFVNSLSIEFMSSDVYGRNEVIPMFPFAFQRVKRKKGTMRSRVEKTLNILKSNLKCASNSYNIFWTPTCMCVFGSCLKAQHSYSLFTLLFIRRIFVN